MCCNKSFVHVHIATSQTVYFHTNDFVFNKNRHKTRDNTGMVDAAKKIKKYANYRPMAIVSLYLAKLFSYYHKITLQTNLDELSTRSH